MSACKHDELELLPEVKTKQRCRHCHLTISAEELGDGFCPECYEATGDKRYDFESLSADRPSGIRYRCERCGAIIERP